MVMQLYLALLVVHFTFGFYPPAPHGFPPAFCLVPTGQKGLPDMMLYTLPLGSVSNLSKSYL
jgi:hypothetical protein